MALLGGIVGGCGWSVLEIAKLIFSPLMFIAVAILEGAEVVDERAAARVFS